MRFVVTGFTCVWRTPLPAGRILILARLRGCGSFFVRHIQFDHGRNDVGERLTACTDVVGKHAFTILVLVGVGTVVAVVGALPLCLSSV